MKAIYSLKDITQSGTCQVQWVFFFTNFFIFGPLPRYSVASTRLISCEIKSYAMQHVWPLRTSFLYGRRFFSDGPVPRLPRARAGPTNPAHCTGTGCVVGWRQWRRWGLAGVWSAEPLHPRPCAGPDQGLPRPGQSPSCRIPRAAATDEADGRELPGNATCSTSLELAPRIRSRSANEATGCDAVHPGMPRLSDAAAGPSAAIRPRGPRPGSRRVPGLARTAGTPTPCRLVCWPGTR